MDMIVTSRTCRYRDREYKRGETISDVLPNHAKVLTTLRKAEVVDAAPVGKVAQTVAPTVVEAPVEEPVAEVEEASEEDAAPRRGRYRRRDLRAED